jgi:hypothetical protein
VCIGHAETPRARERPLAPGLGSVPQAGSKRARRASEKALRAYFFFAFFFFDFLKPTLPALGS